MASENKDSLPDALSPEELAFLKTETGIQDTAELETHIVAIQKTACEGRNLPDPLLLDVGCCFGNDLRRIVHDGFPAKNAIASDLRRDFWDLGHKLFRSTSESFPVTFLAGDAFDANFLALQSPASEAPDSTTPDLGSLKSLNDLHGRLSAIHSASLFHLFSEPDQLQLARKLAGLLAPHPGSIIFGCHGAQPTKGHVLGSRGRHMFCHSPESWREMWDAEVFASGSVEVRAVLKNAGKILNPTTDFHMMFWSVKRL
ncbi:hypothetical protein C8F04DRAFT_1213538 [Mycena alexandri]|uniref:Methyltransferase domain-containing protein n=1 Tax=Mycena alexandri TaxID=1745969 RepID=A0AAD6S7E8_9AGAR|nr:hypothetical protein C8F04DRAFT_1213538 [Mycena alexandri]